MQRTLRLTLLLSAILLAGCSRSVSDLSEGHFCDRWGNDDLIVGDFAYNTVMGYVQKNQLIDSIVLVFPNEQHYFPLIMHGTAKELKAQIHRQEDWTKACKHTTFGGFSYSENDKKSKIADVKLGYVYFIDDGKIAFQKSLRELGVDIDSSLPQFAFERGVWKPILETLIREHVQPQDTETETKTDKPHEE